MSGADREVHDADTDNVIAGDSQVAVNGWACDRCGNVNEPGAEFCGRCGADGRSAMARQLPSAPRFPSDLQRRRSILEAIASSHEKYARPFEQGKVALVSLIGTENWSDYGTMVLQMAMLDTLLSIEEKLTEVLTLARHEPDGGGLE